MIHAPRLSRTAVLLTALALTLLLGVLAYRWWERSVEQGLARWAVDEMARRTGGVYRLVLSNPSFRPLDGTIAFDSVIATTDSVANHRRSVPLPVLEWRAHGCRLSGLDVLRVLLRRSFVARELGCGRVDAALALAPAAERGGARDSVGVARGLSRTPLGLSSFRVASIAIPRLGFSLRRPGARGEAAVRSARARFEARNVVFEPVPKVRARPSLSAAQARLSGADLELRFDSLTAITVAGFEASFADSALRAAGVRHQPAIPEREWVRRLRFRRDRIRFDLDSLRARGVAWRAFIATGAIGIRLLELDRPRLDVLSDWRLPRGRPRHHPIPQQVAAAHGPAVQVDSLVVTHGAIAYRERRPKRDVPGQVTFDAVGATVRNLDLPSRGQPLTIVARARIMNQGWLTVEASVPLHAPDFRYRLSGRLGSMPATAFNRMLSENEAYEVAHGWVEDVTFRQTAKGGRTVTTLTPRYSDLSLQPTGEGGGVFGSVKRAVQKFVANAFKVRSRNPGEDGKDLRTVHTSRRYDPADPWLRFLWISLRDGLVEGMKE